MNEVATPQAEPRGSMMKSGKVAAAIKSDPDIFGGLMNAQSASGSGRIGNRMATPAPAGEPGTDKASG